VINSNLGICLSQFPRYGHL